MIPGIVQDLSQTPFSLQEESLDQQVPVKTNLYNTRNNHSVILVLIITLLKSNQLIAFSGAWEAYHSPLEWDASKSQVTYQHYHLERDM